MTAETATENYIENESRLIILGDGAQVYMTFEQVLEQFGRLIEKWAHKTINCLVYNKPEFEDVMQQMYVGAWKAFCRYDPQVGAFSTYLVQWMKSVSSSIIDPLFVQKRTNNGVVSLNKQLGEDGSELEKFFGKEDLDVDDFEFSDMMSGIIKQLSDVEKVYLKYFLDPESNSSTIIGNELGVSRQAAHKGIMKFKTKLQDLLKEEI